ncbi:MAG: tonB-system energizer ExbB [Thalassovita sp.]
MRKLTLLPFVWAATAQSATAQDLDLTALRAQATAWFHAASADHLSPVGMFMAADWVVKAVMLSLAFASILTWAIFAARMLDIAWSRRRLARAYRRLDKQASLAAHKDSTNTGVVAHMIRAALREVERTGNDQALKSGIKDRVTSELSRIEAGAARRKGKAVGILANIGSTAPFVGLFGTVWGIMNSFISISESNTTNLAVVAPGIAEALLATAIGLVAAIPAVIFYNLITRAITGYRLMLTDSAALVERTLSRDLDLGRLEPAKPGLALATAAAE